MADQSQILKILLQVQADVADLGKVTTGLKDVEAQATQTAAAVNAASRPSPVITDTTAAAALTPEMAQAQAYEAEIAQIAAQERAYSDAYAAEWIAAAQAAGAARREAAMADLEASAGANEADQARIGLQERINSVIAQRQAIVGLEVEQAQALAARNAEQATALGAELELRKASLNLQTSARFTEEEALVLAKQRIAAEAEVATGGLLVGANLNKARNEALVLGRELATGSVNARTLGAFLGSFGTTLTVAGLAGYALFETVSKIGQETRDLDEKINQSSDDLNAQVLIWQELAGAAGKFADVVSLGAKGVAELTVLTQQLNAAKNKPLGFLDTVGDAIATGAAGGYGTGGPGPLQAAQTAAVKAAQDELNRALATAVATTKEAQQATADWQAELAKPPVAALADYNAKLDDAKAKMAAIDPSKSAANFAAWEQAAKYVELVSGRLDELQKRQDAYTNAVAKSKDQTKLLNDESVGNEQAVIADKVKAAYDEIYKSKLAAHVPDAEAQQLAQSQSQALGQQLQHQLEIKGAAAGTRDAHREISASIREEGLQLQAIKGYMQVIDQDPFATVFEKADAQAKLIPAAMQAIEQSSQRLKNDIKGGALDPQQLEQARQKLLQNDLEVIKLGNDFKKLGFGGTLQADLVAWVNQFGTAAHQIAGLITGTIGSAIDTLSSGISGVLFKTESLGQAALQMGEQFVTSLIRVGLQMIAQKLLGSILTATTVTEQTAAGASIAAANAPAAAATSIASYGGAAASGAAAAAAAIAAIIGALGGGGGFEEGGFTGGVSGRVAGIVHGEEFVFSAPAVRRAGIANLEQAHRALSRPGYAAGGYVGALPSASNRQGGSAMKQTLIFVSEMKQAIKEHLKSTDGHKAIINAITGARYELGLAR